MFRTLIKKIFGNEEYSARRNEDQKLEGARENRRPDFQRADEYPYDHYTGAVEDIKQLKREHRHEEAQDLLLWCIDFTEIQARREYELDGHTVVAPWYYKHLAIVYRKDDRFGDEVGILERYVETMNDLGGTPKDELVNRLERARELASG
jgi:hypothetical protein